MKLTKQQVERLEMLQVDGRLDPRAVLADAKEASSPLHDLYEWDALKAAEQHWFARTEEIIRSAYGVFHTETGSVTCVLHVHDPESKAAKYVSVATLRTNESTARKALEAEFARIAGNMRRALDLARVLGLEAEVEALLSMTLGLQRELSAPISPEQSATQ